MALPCEEEGQRFRMANNSQTTCSWSVESRRSNAFAWTASSSGTSISPSELTAPTEPCRYPPPDQVGANLRALHHLFGPKQLGQNEGNATPKPPREEGELTSLDALTRASTRVCPSWKGVWPTIQGPSLPRHGEVSWQAIPLERSLDHGWPTRRGPTYPRNGSKNFWQATPLERSLDHGWPTRRVPTRPRKGTFF